MINNELKNYIEVNILPVYKNNEQGHGIKHIEYVIRRSLNFASQVQDINLDIVYTVACYHDIGHHIDAKNHEKISADIFMKDNGIKEFFTSDQIITIFEAIQDHRASGDGDPRSIYGKIVSSADRRTDVDDIMKSMYTYRLKHSPEYTVEDVIEESYKQICRKFAYGGYATTKMYFNDDEFNKLIEKAEYFKQNKDEFIKYYCNINKINI